MKGMAMRTKIAVIVGAAIVAVLAYSGVALAATFAVTKTVPTTGAATTANVKAYFNHNIKASTVTSSTFKIKEDGTTTWLGATRSVNNTITPTSTNGSSESVATLNPSADLASNTTYKVVLVGGSSGVKDSNGAALAANKSWTFTTAGTTPSTAPTVVSSTLLPAPASTGISPSTNVTATFSEAMDANTLRDPTTLTSTTFTLNSAGGSVAAHVTYDATNTAATLDPDFDLQGGTFYTATIKGGSEGVKDTQGESLAQDFSWNFTTAATGGGCVIGCD
jgi:hypothetical protein